jgi:Type II secretion system (T2SS), protein F
MLQASCAVALSVLSGLVLAADANIGRRRLTRLGLLAQRFSGPPGESDTAATGATGATVATAVTSLIAAIAGGLAADRAGRTAGLLGSCAFGSLVALLMRRRQAGPGLARPASRRGVLVAHSAALPSALPAALDLLAACLAAGGSVAAALEAVANAFEAGSPGEARRARGSRSDGGVGDLLKGAGRLTALGAAPEVAWAQALADPHWAAVGRSVIRAHHSGASLAEVLTRAADDCRRTLRTSAEAAAARAAVRAVVPLGLCFLPAFVLVGVVPVVAGFAGTLWS